MFADLHALAQSATLLIAVTAEGEDLRVSVTPMADGGKPHKLVPLSLLGTPAELEADFGNAMIAWQAPRKSVVDQVKDQVDNEKADSGDSASPAPTPPKKAASPAPTKGKPGPKKKEPPAAPADSAAQSTGAATPGDDDKPEFELQAPVAEVPAAEPDPKSEPEPEPAEAPVVDTKTLDLF